MTQISEPIEAATGAHSRALPAPLWAVTIFLSAFLLFAVEPILGKIILPWFGGASAVWITSLMFFQIVYLLGNVYAHWLIRYAGGRFQARVHVLILAASLLLLPIVPAVHWKPLDSVNPIPRILGLLATTIGLPFLLLSATSPLLQAWYTRAREGAQPYRLYALSNIGSLLALLSYPVLIEPRIATRHQAIAWSVLYASFVALCGIVALRQPASNISQAQPAVTTPRPDWKLQLLWVALAADASVFLLAVTNHLSQNVAPVPLLWVIPLALYLLSLILCFEGRNWYRRFLFLRLLAVALGGMAYALSPDFANAGPLLQVPLFCAGLFICCMVCHGELAKLKPAPDHLTSFYLMIALGGALGGVFVAIIAPLFFRGFYELPVAIAGCAILLRIVLHRDPSTVFYKRTWQPASLIVTALVGLLIVSLFVVGRRETQQAQVLERNFYGLIRVNDLPADNGQPARRELVNGTITHGVEILAADRRREATTYYGPESGGGLVLTEAGQRKFARVGIVGLGAGTLATYGQPGDHYTFYEINPLVIRLAETDFDFLRDSSAQINIVPGDARLSLEREPPQNFDVLVLDAFSGDAIPVHLLTREAFALYFRHLKPTGILAVHVSNKYLNLEPIVDADAASLGVSTTTVINPPDLKNEVYTSTWVLVSKAAKALNSGNFSMEVFSARKTRKLRPWTDDYSNLIQILK